MPVKAFGQLTGRLIQQLDKADGPVEIQPLLQRYRLVRHLGKMHYLLFNNLDGTDLHWMLSEGLVLVLSSMLLVHPMVIGYMRTTVYLIISLHSHTFSGPSSIPLSNSFSHVAKKSMQI